MVEGGKLLGQGIRQASGWLVSKLRPSAPKQVSESTKKKIHEAKLLSGAACKGKQAHVEMNSGLTSIQFYIVSGGNVILLKFSMSCITLVVLVSYFYFSVYSQSRRLLSWVLSLQLKLCQRV